MAEPRTLPRVNPLTSLAIAVLWFVAATIVFEPYFLAALLLATTATTLIAAPIGPAVLLQAYGFFGLAGLGLLQANLLFHENAGWYARSLAGGIGRDAVYDGITLFLRAVVYGAISLAFVASLDAAALVRALVHKLKLAPHLAFSLLGALQCLPLLAQDYRQLRYAHAMRRDKPRWYRVSPVKLVIPLLASAVRRASRAAISMEARGLARGMTRTSFKPSRWSWADAGLLAASTALLLAIWWLTVGAGWAR
jgi:energy-coupling factor transport system permease protein